MSWRREFGEKYEVPKFLDFLVEKKVVEDISWHNDVAPSFGVYQEEPEREIRLWVDHPVKGRREVGGSRFWITVGEPSTAPDDEWVFDELEDALEKLFEQLVPFKGGAPKGVKEWSPENPPESPWDEPQEYLHDLLTEFYR